MLHLKCSHPTARLLLFTRFYSASTSPIVLRPYQEHCLTSCLEALDNGVSRIGVSLPTGSGKTTVFITLLSRMRALKEDATRSLVIVNSIELARQSAATAKQLFPEWSVEIEQGAKHTASGHADLTVATYQTLLNSTRFSKFDPNYFKAVIVDEAHHAAAPSYRKLLARFHQDIRPKGKDDEYPEHQHRVPILGFSATFSRHDSLALGAVFEEIVYHRNFLEMIEEDWLCNVRLTSVGAKMDLSSIEVSSLSGDFKTKSLANAMNTPAMNEMVAKVWLDRAAERRKSTLVFCVDLAHVADLTNTFRTLGVDARYIHSLTPAQERKQLVSSFRAGEFPILVNCAVLTEGADIPNIDCVLLARPTRSQNVFMQMIGRGMRLSPATGKDDCLLIDFVDSTDKVDSVVSLPTLMGIDAWDMDKDVTLDELKEHVKSMAKPSADTDNLDVPYSVVYTDHENIMDSFDGPGKDGSYRGFSPFAWVQCRADIYILECLGSGYVQVNKDGHDHWQVQYFNRQRHRPREIMMSDSLRDALRGADTYIERKVVGNHLAPKLYRNASWRKAPASSAQIDIVAKKRAASVNAGTNTAFDALVSSCVKPSRRSEVMKNGEISSITKGEASTILCKLMHGGLRAIKERDRTNAKSQKAADKSAAIKLRLDGMRNPQSLLANTARAG